MPMHDLVPLVVVIIPVTVIPIIPYRGKPSPKPRTLYAQLLPMPHKPLSIISRCRINLTRRLR